MFKKIDNPDIWEHCSVMSYSTEVFLKMCHDPHHQERAFDEGLISPGSEELLFTRKWYSKITAYLNLLIEQKRMPSPSGCLDLVRHVREHMVLDFLQRSIPAVRYKLLLIMLENSEDFLEICIKRNIELGEEVETAIMQSGQDCFVYALLHKRYSEAAAPLSERALSALKSHRPKLYNLYIKGVVA